MEVAAFAQRNGMRGRPFCCCTHTAISARGEIYASNGYANARVHKYAPDGRLLFSWGESGTNPRCFDIIHNICCDDEGWVYVADRENHRIQVFDGDGRYESQWNNLHRSCGLFMEPRQNGAFYISKLGPFMAINRDLPNVGPRISILAHDGSLPIS